MIQIPDDKRYFRISEAARIIGVEPYVLRFWENKFSQIRPQRADSKQRTYQRRDLITLFEIKRLLYEEKMTIEGAKKCLRQENSEKTTIARLFIDDINSELFEILKILT